MSATTTAKLSESSNPPGAHSPSWSARIADRYGCVLSSDLADWFDSEIWRAEGEGEFHQAADASTLLEPAPEVIWPGLMPCDFLPLVSNGVGDWLCARIGADNRIADIVHWYHGGGDWIPWGRNLSEALLFDTLLPNLPGRQRRHAVPAESTRPERLGDRQWTHWAIEHVAGDRSIDQLECCAGDDLAGYLLEHNIAEVAVRAELVLEALEHPLSHRIDVALARQLELDWKQVSHWVFDLGSLDAGNRQRLAEAGIDTEDTQDWDAAANHCQAVSEICPELPWAWDLMGYAAQRRGDQSAAMDAYHRGLVGSAFADQSVRMRTHWTHHQAAKFSAAQLANRYSDSLGSEELRPYLDLLCLPDLETRRIRVTGYWMERAAESENTEHWHRAHQHLMSAGWDLGAEPMPTYAPLLDRLAESARQSSQFARATLAATHRDCLRERYGI